MPSERPSRSISRSSLVTMIWLLLIWIPLSTSIRAGSKPDPRIPNTETTAGQVASLAPAHPEKGSIFLAVAGMLLLVRRRRLRLA